jgi:hypothetical protein
MAPTDARYTPSSKVSGDRLSTVGSRSATAAAAMTTSSG